MTSSETYGLPQFLAALLAGGSMPAGDRLPIRTGEFTLLDVPARLGLGDIARLIGDFQGLDHEVKHFQDKGDAGYLDIRFHSGRSRNVVSSAYLTRKGQHVTVDMHRPESANYKR